MYLLVIVVVDLVDSFPLLDPVDTEMAFAANPFKTPHAMLCEMIKLFVYRSQIKPFQSIGRPIAASFKHCRLIYTIRRSRPREQYP